MKMARKSKDQLPAVADAAALEAALRDSMKESAQAMVAAEPVYSAANIIRMKGGEFFLNDTNLPKPLQAVVLGWSFGQFYYEDEYDPDSKSPPVCFALSPTEGELVPSDTSPKKQHDGPCATCPQNKPGSHEKGGWLRACSGRRRLGILLINDKSPDPAIGSMEISSAGLKPFSQYVKSVAGVHGAPLYLVATSFGTELTRKGEGAPMIVASFGELLTRIRPEWLTPAKGTKVGAPGWLDTTIVGRKVRELQETKLLLSPPSLVAPEKKDKRPVTGAKRVSVKDAKQARGKK
jgi:hypothetical protein